ncbi:hypothetical protein IWX49DRAFT_198635 [Phyllosticta citricarpa]|uniref:Secreted protein n=2 Tax=Phyllosticta TaxID=121621 RepID=A0ABR1LYE4_9PEZI
MELCDVLSMFLVLLLVEPPREVDGLEFVKIISTQRLRQLGSHLEGIGPGQTFSHGFIRNGCHRRFHHRKLQALWKKRRKVLTRVGEQVQVEIDTRSVQESSRFNRNISIRRLGALNKVVWHWVESELASLQLFKEEKKKKSSTVVDEAPHIHRPLLFSRQTRQPSGPMICFVKSWTRDRVYSGSNIARLRRPWSSLCGV